jgi:hypothetical protein
MDRAMLLLFLLFFYQFCNAQSYKYYPAGLGTSQLSIWIDPSDESTLTLTNGNEVVSIRDKTINQYSFSRWYTNFGPSFDPTSKTISFIRSGEPNTAQILYSPITALSSPASIFKIYRNTNLTGKGVSWSFQRYFGDDPGYDRAYIFLPRDTVSIQYFDRSIITYPNAAVLGNYSLVSLIDKRPPNEAILQINGANPTSLTGGNTLSPRFTNSDVLFLGSTFIENATRQDQERFDGNIGEFVVYKEALNNAQVTLVENYLSEKWGLPIGNDYYVPPSIEFKHELVGIGQTDATNKVLKTQNSSGGLLIEDNGFINNFNIPQFILAAHDNTKAGVAWSKPIDLTINGNTEEYYRWSRKWYIDVTSSGGGGGSGSGGKDINLTFNFKDYYNLDSEAPVPGAPYFLIYSADGNFDSNNNNTQLVKSGSAIINTTTGTVTFSKVDVGDINDGYYTIASTIATSLNFEIRNLQAQVQKTNLIISWEVDHEEEIDSYSIEVSTDGFNFKTIAQKFPLNTNTSLRNITIPLSECNPFYWRLVIKKKSGENVYSDLNRINEGIGCNTDIKVAFKNNTELIIQAPLQPIDVPYIRIELCDIQGKKINGFLVENSDGSLAFKTGNPLSNGLYILRFYHPSGRVFQKKVLLI